MGVLDQNEFPAPETLPYIPVKINGLNTEDLIPADVIHPENPVRGIGEGIPLESTLKDIPERPSWLNQIGHEMFKMNRLALAGEFIYDTLNESHSNDIVPDGFTAKTEEAIQDFPQQYWDIITDAKSPNDLLARQQKAREQMEEDEKFSHNSLSANIIGGLAGFMSDPTNLLIPLAVGGKYASIAQNVFLNMGKVSSGIALDSVSRNLLIQADRIGGNVEDLATDSLRDFMFSTALVGVGGAIGGGLRETKLWNTRKFFNFGADGINVSPVVNEEGIIIKEAHATAMPGNNVSAAQVDAANLYINETMHMGGLFHIPYVGKPISEFLAWGPLASPVMIAMNSKSASLKSFFNRIVPHGIITSGEINGVARPFTAFEYAEAYNDEARGLAQYIRGKYLEANGLSGGANVKNAIKNFVQTKSNNQLISQEQFGIEIRNAATIEGYKSKWSQVHEVADETIKFFKKMGIDYHNAVGEGNIFLDPRNAFKYLPQNWNIPVMLDKPDKWKEITNSKLADQDFTIGQLMHPINSVTEQIETLRSELKARKAIKGQESEIERLKNAIKEAETLKFRHQNELNNHLLDTPDLHILLEDRVLFNEHERNQLNAILDPLRELRRQKIVFESKLKPYEAELKVRKNDQSIKDKVEEIRLEVEAAEARIQDEIDSLQRRAREGEIERKFFHREGDEYIFHDPNKEPKFRKLFESQRKREEYTQQAYDSIMNQTPNDLLQGVFGSVDAGIIERPAYLKGRHLLFDTTEHNNLGFLDPDISKSIASYANTMGKIIGFKKVFPEFADKKGFEGVLAHFQSEHTTKQAEIESQPDTIERANELRKLQKNYIKDKQFMKDTYEVFMGTHRAGRPETYRMIQSFKSLVASSKLGAVPIYQLAELGAIVMKQGIMPFFAQGLRPMIKTFNGHLKGAEAEERRLNAANAHLALWTVRNGYAEKLVNSNSMSYVKASSISEKVGIATDNLSHVSGNLFGINYIANANETLAANLFQSNVMQAAFAHEAGNLSKKQLEKMAHYGIDIRKEAKRFIKEYKNAEGFEMNGGYYSRYYKWDDTEASNIMSMAMRRMVKDTIVNGDRFSSPYWAQDPIYSAIFMFHGWAYGALTHYAIPLMQRPDAENMLGMLMVVGLSMLAEPLKRLANGKEAYDNDSTWFDEAYKALDYSGILGPYAEWFQDFNSGLGGAIAPQLISEKYKSRQSGVGSFGPIAGYIADTFKSTGTAIKGNWTENDVKRAWRLLPLSSFLPVRAVANKIIESLNLPQTRQSANTWAYRQSLFGEGK